MDALDMFLFTIVVVGVTALAIRMTNAPPSSTGNDVFVSGTYAVTVLGRYGMDPWGPRTGTPPFGDTNAQWIWRDGNALGGATPGTAATFTRTFTSPRAFTGTLNAMVCDIGTVYFNGDAVMQLATGGWGTYSLPTARVAVQAGNNTVKVTMRCINRTAGLCLTLLDETGVSVMHTDGQWMYV